MKKSIVYGLLFLALLFLGSCTKPGIENESDNPNIADKLILYSSDTTRQLPDRMH